MLVGDKRIFTVTELEKRILHDAAPTNVTLLRRATVTSTNAGPAPATPDCDTKLHAAAHVTRTNDTDTCSESSDYSDASDESTNATKALKSKHMSRERPPIGVFWDIENCHIPKDRSAVTVVQQIRNVFFHGHREAEFLVVCDVRKENNQILQELNDAQVNLIHVTSTCKNAADEKLRQAMRRFADTYRTPATIILISSDINFASDLSDLRHRKHMRIVLLHNTHVSDALVLCANEHYTFSTITDAVPMKKLIEKEEVHVVDQQVDVIVSDLPIGYDLQRLRNRLKQLSSNCGGKVIYISLDSGEAIVRFTSFATGIRAQKRMDGEDVYGHKISASHPRAAPKGKTFSPPKSLQRRLTRQELEDTFQQQSIFNATCGYSNAGNRVTVGSAPTGNYFMGDRHHIDAKRGDADGSENEPPGVTSTLSFANVLAAQNQSRMPYQSENFTLLKRTDQSSRANRSPHDLYTNSGARKCYTPDDHCQHVTSDAGFLSTGGDQAKPVDLCVTNLDNMLDVDEMRQVLLSAFREYARVLYVNIYFQHDGNMAATVRVASQHDAQYAISQLHHRRIGYKRIVISYATNATNATQIQLKTQVLAVLKDVPNHRLSLFKFRTMYDARFHSTISVGDLSRMPDICRIYDDNGRMIALVDHPQAIQPMLTDSLTDQSSILNMAFCQRHGNKLNQWRDWAVAAVVDLPNVRVSLKQLSERIHALLKSHDGYLPIFSLLSCYEAECHDRLTIDDLNGVPLEHLVTCVPNVELRQTPAKHLTWSTATDTETPVVVNFRVQMRAVNQQTDEYTNGKTTPPQPLQSQFSQVTRELIELLRATPTCRLPFNKFMASFHHHFGRQCRIADYGFTKLSELFDALSHVVQVVGEGDKRFITLTHRTQMRRFANDVLRVLRSCMMQEIALTEFGTFAERVLNRAWNPVNYGMCETKDLFRCLPDNVVVIRRSICSDGNNVDNVDYDDAVITLPKREQTAEEFARTRSFARDVIELLSHMPYYSVTFNKFVPSYHHYFNAQCKMNDYGFTRLIELFKAVSDVVQIEEMSDGEKLIRLVAAESLKIFANQLTHLLRVRFNSSITAVEQLAQAFSCEYGYGIEPNLFGCTDLVELFKKLPHVVHVSHTFNQTPYIQLSDSAMLLGLKVWGLFCDLPDPRMSVNLLMELYSAVYGDALDVTRLEQIARVVQIRLIKKGSFVRLTPMYVFASEAYDILFNYPCGLAFSDFTKLYYQKYCREPPVANCLDVIGSDLMHIITMSGPGSDPVLEINYFIHSVGIPVPQSNNSNQDCPTVRLNRREWIVALWLQKQEQRYSSEPPKPDTPPKTTLKQSARASWPVNKHLSNVTCMASVWSPPDFKRDVNLEIPVPSPPSTAIADFYKETTPGTPRYNFAEVTPPPAESLPQPPFLDGDTLTPSERLLKAFSKTPGHERRKVKRCMAAQFTFEDGDKK